MSALQHQVEQFLYEKSALCDARDWDAYVGLFTEDCEFHLPQWNSEYDYTRDPKTGISLIYYSSRAGLEDRVFRLRTGKASSALPLPRTLHKISNVRITEESADELVVEAGWHTLFTRMNKAEEFYGYVTYRLVKTDAGFRIRRKHIVLLNDVINSVLDFYHL